MNPKKFYNERRIKVKYERGNQIGEGKTKILYNELNHPGLLVIENKDEITAFNDPEATQQFLEKGAYCTTITCRIFEILEAAGIPTAFVKQIGPTEFVAKKVIMIMLEAVSRRLGIGSYLKRFPWNTKDIPMRFHRLVTEYFLKTTKGGLIIDGETLIGGLTKEADDPFIANPNDKIWKLLRPDMPEFHPDADLLRTVNAQKILGDNEISDMDIILRKVTLLLEGLFQVFGYRFADMKIEFGITEDGDLVVADVIDADSWRLLTHNWISFSKQAFRDGEDLAKVEKKYGQIARMSEFFRIPRQALVIWKGSKDDPIEVPSNLPGVHVEEIIQSGHKGTHASLMKLEELMRDYPDGGIIIGDVGRSNGLGPTLSTHTQWTVISVPPDWKQKPQNIWSHLDMPSLAPHLVSLYENNALTAALQILAQKNPILYMMRQLEIEKLDPGY